MQNSSLTGTRMDQRCSVSPRCPTAFQFSAGRRRIQSGRIVCQATGAPAGQFYNGKSIKPPAKGKHFLHLDDFTKDELQDMLDKGLMAKKKFYARDESFKPFAGQTMAMIFTKPSARTRVSFETVSSVVAIITAAQIKKICPTVFHLLAVA